MARGRALGGRASDAALTALAALTLAGARGLGAQAAARRAGADSLPARAGTWALEGGVGVRASTFGALRFLGARTALGLQLGAGYTTTAFEAPGTDSLVPAVERGEVRSTSTYAAATLGVRRYGPVRGALAGFAGLGATVRAYASQSGRAHGDEHAVGAVLEGGAAYLVARHLSVNASATASLVRTRGQQRGEFGPVQRTYGYDASLGQVGVSATLFF